MNHVTMNIACAFPGILSEMSISGILSEMSNYSFEWSVLGYILDLILQLDSFDIREPKISGDIPEVTVSGDRSKTASTITKTSPLKLATLAVFHFPCAFEQPIGRRRNIPGGLVTFLADTRAGTNTPSDEYDTYRDTGWRIRYVSRIHFFSEAKLGNG